MSAVIRRTREATTAAERSAVTLHAIRRYQERIDATATDAEARDAILVLLASARVERTLPDGAIQMRARGRAWPGRVRLRIGPGDGHAVAVLTVLPEHDGARPRKRHPRGAYNGQPATRYEPDEEVGAWTIVRWLGKGDNGAHMYEARCRCGTVRVKQASAIRRDVNGCRTCAARAWRASRC